MKRAIDRVHRIEFREPARLEVDGIDQDEARVRADHARGDQVVDLVVGLLLDPAIDRLPGLFRRVLGPLLGRV